MIIKLNPDSTITIVPQTIPEPLDHVYISYVFPKGLNHLRPVLVWGGVIYEGQEKYISKSPENFTMKVTLYNGTEVYKEYRATEAPTLFMGYRVETLEPNLLAKLRALEKENKNLKERGDII